MNGLLTDLRSALRALRGSLPITLLALVCLALGIGSNTAMFSIANAVVFRPLPFVEPDRLVAVHGVSVERDVDEGGLPYADLQSLRATRAFAAVEGLDDRTFVLTGGEITENIAGAVVTPGLFEMLGVRPRVGRAFRADDAAPSGFEQVALISDDLWRRRFGADPGVVGRTLHLNGREIAVAGVMPPDFRFPENEHVWLPLGSADTQDRVGRYIRVMARLTPGVDGTAAQERVADTTDRLAALHPATHAGWTARVRPLREDFVDRDGQRLMLVLLGSVGFVLLIACANVANLLLARGSARRRELAVRAALGASRGRIVRQLLAESMAVAAVAGVVGLLIAMWWTDALIRMIPEELDYWIRIEVDPVVLAFAIGLSAVTALLFGTYPALHASRTDFGVALSGGTRAGGDTHAGRVRSVLIVAEVALSLVLLVGASLMIQSFLRLQAADPGFAEEPILSFRLTLAGDHYDPAAAKALFHHSAAERLAALPGVAAAASTTAIPADDGGAHIALRAGGSDRSEARALIASRFAATAGFFDALGLELVSGRAFTQAEVLDTVAAVAIVNERLAARLWPDGDPVGRVLVVGDDDDGVRLTVVGVAPDLVYEEFGEETMSSRLQLHVPYGAVQVRQTAFLVRATDGDPAGLVPRIRRELRAMDPSLALFDAATLVERRRLTTWEQRVFGQLFGTFGAIALVLAVTGVYGVMAYAVVRRRREIGVRMAIGARPSEILAMVVGNGLRLAGAGIAIGVIAALAMARVLTGALFDVAPTDPATFAVVAGALGTAALAACALPARRAASVSPVEALREE